MSNARCVLVVGGAGFIGSHTLRALLTAGYDPVVLDDLSSGHRAAVPDGVPVIAATLADIPALERAFDTFKPASVIHFAAFIEAGMSMVDPARFYHNNVVNTFHLLEVMRAREIQHLVFSSSAGVYGEPEAIPVVESAAKRPVSVYGETKWMVEQMLQAYDRSYGLRSLSLRYFNACGADPSGTIGEAHRVKSHLIELALLTALGQRDAIKVFGTDYPTPDGTAIRDYIHVCDLASAHVRALQALQSGHQTDAFNVGLGRGFSVKEVLDVVDQVTGQPLTRLLEPRRAGDPAILVADASRLRDQLHWQPTYTTLEEMVSTAWQWHRLHPHDFSDVHSGA